MEVLFFFRTLGVSHKRAEQFCNIYIKLADVSENKQ